MKIAAFALSLAVLGAAAPASALAAEPAQQQQLDPADMLNQAVALARAGRDEEARALFLAVRKMKVDYTLETTDGRWVYPADLARQGLRQLDRGELRAQTIAARD